jgi:hypothetical protein
MPKTNFVDNTSKIPAAWLNKVFTHVHDGQDQDGSAPKIKQTELEDSIRAILNSVAIVQPTIAALTYNSATRTNVFGGNGTDGEYIAGAGNSTLNKGVYNFTNFIIGSTRSVNAQGGLVRIKCTGNVTIDGTLTGLPTTHNRIASGFYLTADPAYNLSASLRGSSGSNGRNSTDTTGLQIIIGQGGKPGTTIIIEALGAITIGATGKIISRGENGQVGQVLSGSHSLPGSGGGTGGAIGLMSLTGIIQSGEVSATGGNGSDGVGTNAEAGSGGSGGYIYIASPANTTTDAQLIVTGGSAGVSYGTRAFKGSPGGSFAGIGGQLATAGEAGIIEKIQSLQYHIY